MPFRDLTSCPNAAARNQKTHPRGSLLLHALPVMTARDQNPTQQAPSTRAMPTSIGFFLGEFPSGKMRRYQQSWHTQAT